MMSFGVEIGDGGVIDNFTMFRGSELMEKSEFYFQDGHDTVEKSSLPDVNGFISGMLAGNFKYQFLYSFLTLFRIRILIFILSEIY